MGSSWGTEVEQEKRNRIRLAVAAWAYEKHSCSFLTDAAYEILSYSIRPSVSTGNRKLDTFFRTKFDPCTGQWVNAHPDRAGLERLWQRHYLAMAL